MQYGLRENEESRLRCWIYMKRETQTWKMARNKKKDKTLFKNQELFIANHKISY